MGSPKKTRENRAAAGLCMYCGKHEPDRGKSKRCQACIEESREYNQRTRDKRKQVRDERAAAGLCMYCGKQPATHGKRCAVCRDRDNATHKKWLATKTRERVSAGLCKSCGKNPIAPRSTQRCNKCLKNESTRTEEQKDKNRKYMKRYYHRLRLEVIDHYTQGHRACQCCGEAGLEFLTIDHVENDGADHRKTTGVVGGMKLFRYLINNNFPAGFQILCWNCNAGKHYYGDGVCPHQRKNQT